ncbi:MAG: integrase arm-type DNA-binding domain-containing protein [Aquabacterium sp.]|jgi:integrase|uniref:tyrosine-type recombinase/integrase n=1 Tax=Aquabacterium sp. TaxID=1872578 RepID=UPI003BAF2F76
MALTDTFVKNVKHTGAPAGDKHTDGHGMFLLVKAAGKYWRHSYRFLGKQKTLALGVYPEVSLAQARQRREQARKLLAEGIDPSQAKRADKVARKLSADNTFEAVAKAWLDASKAQRAESTDAKVRGWLENDVFPQIGRLPIAGITPRDVLDMVRKVEKRGALDSATRIKQLCGQIFRYAVAEGSAERDVTADLRGALAVSQTKHLAAVTEPKQVGELLRAIQGYSGHPVTVAALQLTPMLFVRPGELRHAEWAEIDLQGAEWRIPGSKMKMGLDHIVPLSTQAVEVLTELQKFTGRHRYVFPSVRTGARPMSENTINAALRGMGYSSDVQTAHGFRATARTILDEVLGERVDLIEHQLAHAVKDVNGRAYNRTAHLPARKEMMQRWADYLDKLRAGAEVIPLHAA